MDINRNIIINKDSTDDISSLKESLSGHLKKSTTSLKHVKLAFCIR